MESKQTTTIVIVLAILLGVAYWALSMQGTEAPNTSETATSTESAVIDGMPVVESTPQPVPAALGASISVVADKTSYEVGDSVALSFYIDTPVAIGGADVIFSFDGTKLELVQGLAKENFAQEVAQLATAKVAQSSTEEPLTIGYTNNKKVGDSIVYTFSALARPGDEVSGKTKLGTVILRAKKAGDAPITISFENEGISTDSNIAYQGRDILKSVVGTTIRVQTTTP
jgi:hypothetical protein